MHEPQVGQSKGAKGLITGTWLASKSTVFRVTSVRWWTSAVAASRPSITGIGHRAIIDSEYQVPKEPRLLIPYSHQRRERRARHPAALELPHQSAAAVTLFKINFSGYVVLCSLPW